jgi:hypothetical protein
MTKRGAALAAWELRVEKDFFRSLLGAMWKFDVTSM